MSKKLLVFSSLLLFFLSLQAQTRKASNSTNMHNSDSSLTGIGVSQGDIFIHDFKSYYKGLGYFFSRPVHWKGKDWKNVGLVTAGTLVSMALDEPLLRLMQNNRTPFLNGLENVGDKMGKPVPGFIFSGALYGIGHIAKKNWMRETAIITLTSISTVGLIQTILKGSTGRARPLAGEGNLSFSPFNEAFEYHSFPSGHTIVAASTTLAIAKNIKNKFLKGGIIGLGVITTWSRVYEGAHWFSDVFLSYALSYITVESASKFRKSYNERHPDKRFTMHLIPRMNGASLIVNL